jgi:hypothetical protein
MDVDVGLIYTHERLFMGPLVGSLARSGDGLAMRLVLVDNASAEGVDEWSRIFPRTVVIRNSRRLGYAENLNLILEQSTARYCLLLNTDMYFEPAEQCVAKMAAFMEAHPQCGVGGCRLFHADGSYAWPARRFQTPAIIAGRRLGLGALFSRALDQYLYRAQREAAMLECDWLSGCFLMVRREAYRAVGPFDVAFRKYFEDVDFCLRMAAAGWRVLLNGETWCYHLEQRASRQVLSRDGWLHLRSYLYFLRKWGLQPRRHLQLVATRRAASVAKNLPLEAAP